MSPVFFTVLSRTWEIFLWLPIACMMLHISNTNTYLIDASKGWLMGAGDQMSPDAHRINLTRLKINDEKQWKVHYMDNMLLTIP